MSADASGSTAPAPVWIRCPYHDCEDRQMTIAPETAERGGIVECSVCGRGFEIRNAEVLGR